MFNLIVKGNGWAEGIDSVHGARIFEYTSQVLLDKFKPGDKVQITDGVFKNCVAIFKSFKSDERVILLMNILGQQQAINIKQESLIGL